MPSKKNNILIVSGFKPFPAQFGGAVDIWERLIGLKHLGLEIDLVFTDKNTPKEDELQAMKKVVNNVLYCQRKNKIFQLLSPKPLQALSRNGLAQILLSKKYDIVLLEGEFVAEILNNPTLTYDKLIVRVHNNEAFYFEALKQSCTSPFKKIYYQLEIPKIKKYSAQILEKAHRLWYISADELANSTNQNKGIFLPPPINGTYRTYTPQANKQVLFVGALFMPNNIYAIDWYIKFIHPQLTQHPTYQFNIVGKTHSEAQTKELIKKYEHIDKVQLFVNQNDLSPYFKSAKVFINPMFHGSGVKIKTIEALRNGLPLVSTTVGAEGMNFTEKHYWKAETAEEFTKQINQIFNANTQELELKVQAAQQHLQQLNYLNILKKEMQEYIQS